MSSRIFERLARYEKTPCIARSQAALLPNHCKPVARSQLLWHRYVMFPKCPCGQSWFCLLCWLILCVNLIGLRDTQMARKTLFLGVSMTVFLEEMSIWSSRLRKRSIIKTIVLIMEKQAWGTWRSLEWSAVRGPLLEAYCLFFKRAWNWAWKSSWTSVSS